MNKQIKLVSGIVVLSIVFVGIVPITDLVFALFHPADKAGASEYSTQAMLAGIVSECIRALLTVIIYSQVVNCGTSLWHGVKFGLLFSALIASLYIILGGFYFNPSDRCSFVVEDSIILFVQGLASGVVLFRIFRN